MNRITSLITLTVFLLAGFAIAVAAAGFVHMRVEEQREMQRMEAASNSILALQTVSLYLTIESYDAASRVLVADVYSPAANQFLRQRMQLDEGFSVVRRDAIIENGTILGVRAAVPASEEALQPGVRGIGVLRYAADGTTLISHFEFGEPFSRP